MIHMYPGLDSAQINYAIKLIYPDIHFRHWKLAKRAGQPWGLILWTYKGGPAPTPEQVQAMAESPAAKNHRDRRAAVVRREQRYPREGTQLGAIWKALRALESAMADGPDKDAYIAVRDEINAIKADVPVPARHPDEAQVLERQRAQGIRGKRSA